MSSKEYIQKLNPYLLKALEQRNLRDEVCEIMEQYALYFAVSNIE